MLRGRRIAFAAFAFVLTGAVLSGCAGDGGEGAQPSSTAAIEAASSSPPAQGPQEASRTPASTVIPDGSEAGPTVSPPPAGTAVSRPIVLGEPIAFPDELAVIVETGCSDCDIPTSGYVRIYRDPSGRLRVETLFERSEQASTYRDSINGAAFQSDGSDMVVAVCSGTYCGGLSTPIDPEVTFYRSRDGGITWAESAVLDAPWGPYLVQGDQIVASKSWEGSGDAARMEVSFARFPGQEEVVPPDLGGEPSWPAAVANGELLWATDSERLVGGDGLARVGLDYVTLRWTLPSGQRHTAGYVQVAAHDGTDVAVFVRRGSGSALPLSGSVLLVASYLPEQPRSKVGLALYEAGAGVLHPIAGLPSLADGLRGPMAVQQGPFARVVAGEGSCLNVRDSAALEGEVLDCASDGVLLRRTGAEQDGWLPVATPAGVEGWASVEFLSVKPD